MSTDQESQDRQVMRQSVFSTGEGTRIFPDVEACIDCGGCYVACKRTWDIPRDEQRISISTMLEGQMAEDTENNPRSGAAMSEGQDPGETSVPMQCYHCDNAPCVSVCPTDSLFKNPENDFVEVRDDLCIGCQYCLSGCPFGAPQFPESNDGGAELAGSGGIMDKCTMCEERQLESGKGPACAEECATDAILVGTADQIAEELDRRGEASFFNDEALEIIFGDDAEAFDR
ncbi:4Fe-4S dicluster domain-containing protein [Halostella sp. PRR32]|uniref:4Fe-4S dicluster domain-containing protein n=1 Tax=Halostella sp. PRR32 TaxID=3098147 RepID=UPI002B1D0E76|nr:4Fe-4S dicluster domain-containing protein [Halostella sp. PRR32]